MKSLGLIVGLTALAVLARIGYSASGNPTSNILYDTSATAGTIVARDGSGNFSATVISASQIGLTAQTTTQLQALSPATTGQIVVVALLQNGLPGANYTICVSSSEKIGAWVFTSTETKNSNPVRPCVGS